MSNYPIYALEQYVPISGEWVPVYGYPADDRPHHYDWLREAFDKLVAVAKAEGGEGGYRITVTHKGPGCKPLVVDKWENLSPQHHLAVVASVLSPNGPERDIEARVLAYNRAARVLGWPTWGEVRK